MGMFDSVMVPCPVCQTEAEYQSKTGEQMLAEYTLEDCPNDVWMGVGRTGFTRTCENCGARFELQLDRTVKLIAPRVAEGGVPQEVFDQMQKWHRGALADVQKLRNGLKSVAVRVHEAVHQGSFEACTTSVCSDAKTLLKETDPARE